MLATGDCAARLRISKGFAFLLVAGRVLVSGALPPTRRGCGGKQRRPVALAFVFD